MIVTFRLNMEDADDRTKFEDIKRATQMSIFVSTLYDTVFRPVIKYGDDPYIAQIYQEVWDKVYEEMKQLNIND